MSLSSSGSVVTMCVRAYVRPGLCITTDKKRAVITFALGAGQVSIIGI